MWHRCSTLALSNFSPMMKNRFTYPHMTLMVGLSGLWIACISMFIGFTASLRPLSGTTVEKPIYDVMSTTSMIGIALFFIGVGLLVKSTASVTAAPFSIKDSLKPTGPAEAHITPILLSILGVPLLTFIAVGLSLEMWSFRMNDTALVFCPLFALIAIIVLLFRNQATRYVMPMYFGIFGSAAWLSCIMLLVTVTFLPVVTSAILFVLINLTPMLIVTWHLSKVMVRDASSRPKWEV